MSESGATDETDGETRTISVLYVEDNQQTGPLVREWLERHDDRFEVTLAVTLDAAAERLTSEPYDAVVADYRFPNGKGLGLVSGSRELNPGIPFVLYSARVTEEVKQEAEDAGVTAVIEKGGSDQLSELATRIVTSVDDRAGGDAPPDSTPTDDPLEAFADDLVHDLRGPLSVALGHLDLLETEDERAERLEDALTELEAVVDELPERAAAFDADQE